MMLSPGEPPEIVLADDAVGDIALGELAEQPSELMRARRSKIKTAKLIGLGWPEREHGVEPMDPEGALGWRLGRLRPLRSGAFALSARFFYDALSAMLSSRAIRALKSLSAALA